MSIKQIAKELKIAAKEIEEIQLDEIKNEMKNVADEIEELDFFDDKIAKKASLINEGDRIVCVTPLQGIFKGRLYLAGERVEPNLILVKEEDGEPVGLYNVGRFCIDYRTY